MRCPLCWKTIVDELDDTIKMSDLDPIRDLHLELWHPGWSFVGNGKYTNGSRTVRITAL